MPVGSDRPLEEVKVRNRGHDPVSLAGWVLRDESGKDWQLDAPPVTLNPDNPRRFAGTKCQ
jgi:hypothetical protein